jgi:hypothetical protein
MTRTIPSAGGVLTAVDALQDPARQTFTREQVAYLLRLAYDSGRTAAYVGDLAELHADWARHPLQQVTAVERYADRMAEFEIAAMKVNAALGRPPGYRYDGGPVDFETGRPLQSMRVDA